MPTIDDDLAVFDHDRDDADASFVEEDVDSFEDSDELDDADDSDADDDEDDFDDLDDATDDEIDFVVALYREDGEPVVVPLASDLANDLDELIGQLRRLPGDAGALGAVSIAGEFFVLCRVRGRNVQVLLSDAVAANDWPIARDVADFLGVEIPDPDDDSEPLGDLGILADAGLSEFDMEAIAENLDDESGLLVEEIATKAKFGPQFKKAIR